MSKLLIVIPGTFNPFTKAHEEMGRLALSYVLSANPGAHATLLYVPSSTSFMKVWGKQANLFLSDDERVDCVVNSIEGLRNEFAGRAVIGVSEIEVGGTVSGATFETVNYLENEGGPYDEIFVCLGTDKLEQLPQWRNAEELFTKVHTVVFMRDEKIEKPVGEIAKFFEGKRITFLPIKMCDVSSTAVRTAWYEDKLEAVKDTISEYTFTLLKSKQFDVAAVTAKLLDWVRDWFEKNGKGCNAVIGISGGKDSTVAATVCVAALGKDRVIGVMMPNGVQPDICDSKKICAHLGIKNYEVNIHDAVEGVYNALGVCDGLEISTQSRVNLPPRIRMSTLYAVSQSSNGRVINTCNLSEDWVGYSTRYGDSVGDVSPLSHLTVREVKAIGKYLGVPVELIDKAPSDGLCGKTDEDNLGFTYAMLDRYIRTGDCDDPEKRALIDKKHVANLFKLQLMPSFEF